MGVREIGMRIALATSANEEDLEFYGKLVKMEGLIERASTNSDAKRSEPEPDVFASALEKMNVGPEDAIGLGDPL